MQELLVPEATRRKAAVLDEVQGTAQAFSLKARELAAEADGTAARFRASIARQYREGF
jgi:hypothetical protein